MLYNAYRIQRDPRYWKDPDTLDPLRWDPSIPKTPAAFNAYGGGAKGCFGKDWFIPYYSYVLAELARSFGILRHYCRPSTVVRNRFVDQHTRRRVPRKGAQLCVHYWHEDGSNP